MTPETISLLVLVVFGLCLVCEVPVAFGLAGAGALGIYLLRSDAVATSTMGSTPFNATSSYTLAVVPLYILLGMFAFHGQLATRLFGLASRALRRLPGGLGVATVGACAGFAAVSGSSVATAASIGRLSVSEMRRYGYPAHFAAGLVASAGTLGILIPPSVAMVIYGILAKESIGQLLAAGILPGLMLATAFAAYVVARARTLALDDFPVTSPPVPALVGGGSGEGAPGADSTPAAVQAARPDSTTAQVRALVWIACIFAAIFVGMFTGLFTVIESAAIGAGVAFLMLVLENAHEGAKSLMARLARACTEAASTTAMALALLMGASVLTTFLVMARVPLRFTEWVIGMDMPPLLFVGLVLLALIPMGMFLESMSILIIVVPLVHPVVLELGFNGVWFGVLFVIFLEIGLITPPVGLNSFVVATTTGIKLETVFRGVAPFVGVAVAVAGVLMAFPEIVLWIPSMVSE